MSACPQCHSQNPAHAKFCNQCGTALAVSVQPARQAYTPPHLVDRVLKHRSAMEGERKQVTVFFADMAGSTQLAEQVDAEDWHRILDEFFAILGDEIHRFEGTINQYTGDGIMALFGAPIAHEDHAQRAAFAALALQKRLRAFSDRLRLEQGINLSTRMGMNSGEVVVGTIGDDLRMDYTAKGLTVNLAARMEQIAEPGRIYLTRDTAMLIEDYFELDNLGPMAVKGRPEPVQVFELRGQSAVSLRLEAARERGLTSFAGRTRELATLQEIQRRAGAGQGELLVIIGDAGLGKSRLCFEAAERWRQAGLRVLAVSGVPHAQAVPTQPVRDLIRQRFGILSSDSAETARQKLAGGLLLLDPQLGEQLPLIFDFMDLSPAGQGAPELPPDARNARLLEIYRRICSTAAAEPCVIVVEDLHWIAPAAEEFFQIMVECARCQPGTVIFNMRPGPLPGWLAAHAPRRLTLQPLDQVAMTQMVQSLLGDDPALAPLATRIATQAAGNPFYVEETVRALASAGTLAGEAGRYRLAAPAESIEIPASVQALIAGRVDRLEPEDKALIQIAAVLGPRFEQPLLAAVSQRAGAELETALAALELGAYLRRSEDVHGETQWEFCHPLFQEVVYASLLSDKRVALHRQIAELLELHAREVDDCPSLTVQLAYHWTEAGEAMPAARWSLAAATEMVRHNMLDEIRLLRQALRMLDPLPDHPEAKDLAASACAMVLRAASFYPMDPEEVEAHFVRGRALAEESGNRAVLAEILISNGVRLLNDADADRAMASTSEAMQIAQALEDDSLEARFRIPILFSHFSAGRLREGLAVLDRRDGGRWHQGAVVDDTMYSRGFRALMLAARGELEIAQREARAAIACAERQGLRASWMYANLVDIDLMRGVDDQVMDLARIAVEQAEEFGSPMFLEVAHRAMAQALMAAGDLEAACELLEETLPLVGPGAVARQFETAHRGVLAHALFLHGARRAGRDEIDRAIAAGERSRQRIWTLRARVGRAQMMAQAGECLDDELRAIETLIDSTGAELYRRDWQQLRAVGGVAAQQ